MARLLLTSLFLLTNFSFAKEPQTLLNQKEKIDTDTHRYFKDVVKADVCYIYGARGDEVVLINFDKNYKILSKTRYKKTNQKQTFIFNDNCKLRECLQFVHD